MNITNTSPTDLRLTAFCDPDGIDVFQSVTSAEHVWLGAPDDAPELHEKAREAFAKMLRCTTQKATSGQILLLLGEAGTGKTHTLGAYRCQAREVDGVYFSYLQLTTAQLDSETYLLTQMLQALQHPEPQHDSTIQQLSNALANDKSIPASALKIYKTTHFTDNILGEATHALAARLLNQTHCQHLDMDLVCALFYLQRSESNYRMPALRYLRGEHLNDQDKIELSALHATDETDAPLQRLDALSRLIQTLEGGSLVLTIDQLENLYDMKGSTSRFRRVIGMLTALADRLPSVVIVIACLDDLYERFRDQLTQSMLDRLERAPEPIYLNSACSPEQTQALISRRLRHLYHSADVPWSDDDALYPLTSRFIEHLYYQRARDILYWCHRQQQEARQQGEITNLDGLPNAPKTSSAAPANHHNIAQTWLQFVAQFTHTGFEDDGQYLNMLKWALEHCAEEAEDYQHIKAVLHQRYLKIDDTATYATQHTQALIGMCNHKPQGGALSRQLNTLQRQALRRKPIAIRTIDPFIRKNMATTNRRVKDFINKGGLTLYIEANEWLWMQAFQAFHALHHKEEQYQHWRNLAKPLSALTPMQALLNSTPPEQHLHTHVYDVQIGQQTTNEHPCYQAWG